MKPQTAVRTDLVKFLVRDLVGPEREGEELEESPKKKYSAGILFPKVRRLGETDVEAADDESAGDADDEDDSVAWEEDERDTAEDQDNAPAQPGSRGWDDVSDDNDDTVLLANTYFPAAMGLTFLVDGAFAGELLVEVRAATYEPFDMQREGDRRPRRYWRRLPLAVPTQRCRISSGGPQVDDREAAENLGLRLVARPRTDGITFVTVSIFNKHTTRSETKPPSARQCFYQVGFSVTASGGHAAFLPYDAAANQTRDDEEASLALLYRKRRQFAVGHGCAPGWGDVVEDRVAEVRTETVPAVVVPPVEPTSKGGRALDMYHLAGLDGEPEEQTPETLRSLTAEYSGWIEARSTEVPGLAVQLRPAAEKHLTACKEALRRMEVGIDLLARNAFALRAFQLANRAILMQQYHAKLPNREPEATWPGLPTDYKPTVPGRGRWRSFQIAFFLMNLPAFIDDSAEFEMSREIVDLIWFPTGGGKTEAYLGLTAYAIFLRRLLRSTNGGCVVLMRYTLRLLTAQQFQRAAALICACELLRSQDERRLGREVISLGLWVGGQASPNTRKDAAACLKQLAKAQQDDDRKRENLLQLLACPWCGTRLDRPKSLGYVAEGGTVVFRCWERRCTFSQPRTLPVTVIDEDIYDSPPTLVIGTVDKFAMLAWKSEAASLFGIGKSPAVDPPDLIIQDELHLISGPLGSMVGLYESVIEYLSTGTKPPKIVASTATIRRAQEQCWALYHRNAFQFPPPGLDVGDSFFAQENRRSDGRLYVGVFASAAPSPVTALVRTAAALHQGAKSVPVPPEGREEHRDPYWTQLQYFGSLRELGRAATLVEQDIPEYLQVIRKRLGLSFRDLRRIHPPVELTSRLTAEQVPEILEDLKIPYVPGDPSVPSARSKRPIDVLLATNMISVGVDVDRLGLMVVVGQPKTTSEYIQASSRVGRSKDAPGLVIALYNAGKPRDRSHYEQFRSYHEAFYRHVEPTSVTPFSIPVLERALHALVVIVARHVCGVRKPSQLKRDDKKLARFLEFLKRRSEKVDSEHAQEVARRLQAKLDEWLRYMPAEFGSLSPYSAGGTLLIQASAKPADADDPAWRTPTSMRNVDAECFAKVLQLPYAPEELP